MSKIANLPFFSALRGTSSAGKLIKVAPNMAPKALPNNGGSMLKLGLFGAGVVALAGISYLIYQHFNKTAPAKPTASAQSESKPDTSNDEQIARQLHQQLNETASSGTKASETSGTKASETSGKTSREKDLTSVSSRFADLADSAVLNTADTPEKQYRLPITQMVKDIQNAPDTQSYFKAFDGNAPAGNAPYTARYVKALDSLSDFQTPQSIPIHAAAIAEALERVGREDSPQKHALEEANKIMASALAIRKANLSYTNISVKPITTYKRILDYYGSAVFPVRTGTAQDGADSFTHFGAAILERSSKDAYQIRFANPSLDYDVMCDVKTNNIRDVLSQLDDVYCNEDPKNNLGDKSIGPDMIDARHLSGKRRQVKRAPQTGAQCGIHSSKRILPADIYQHLKVNDCDISGILEAS